MRFELFCRFVLSALVFGATVVCLSCCEHDEYETVMVPADVVLEGLELASFCAWHEALTQSEARQWDGFLQTVRPANCSGATWRWGQASGCD